MTHILNKEFTFKELFIPTTKMENGGILLTDLKYLGSAGRGNNLVVFFYNPKNKKYYRDPSPLTDLTPSDHTSPVTIVNIPVRLREIARQWDKVNMKDGAKIESAKERMKDGAKIGQEINPLDVVDYADGIVARKPELYGKVYKIMYHTIDVGNIRHMKQDQLKRAMKQLRVLDTKNK